MNESLSNQIRTGLLVACMLLATTALGQVEPLVNPQPGGNVRVEVGSCRVLFDHTGRTLEFGEDCSRGDIGDANRAFRTWHRQQTAPPPPAPTLVPAPIPNQRPAREPAPPEPTWTWVVTTNAPGSGISLRDRPERGSRVVVDRIGNGARLRSYGCTMTGRERWCEVEFERRRGWLAERYLAEEQAVDRGAERGAFSFDYRSRGIRIDRVDYGADYDTCDATPAFAERCDGRTSCSVPVDNDLCGDPARGTRKAARIDYSCSGRSSRGLVVEEGDTAVLECR